VAAPVRHAGASTVACLLARESRQERCRATGGRAVPPRGTAAGIASVRSISADGAGG